MTKNIQAGLITVGALFATAATADPVSYAAITSAVDVSTVAAGIVAMGALMVVPNVARWAVRKLAGFFR